MNTDNIMSILDEPIPIIDDSDILIKDNSVKLQGSTESINLVTSVKGVSQMITEEELTSSGGFAAIESLIADSIKNDSPLEGAVLNNGQDIVNPIYVFGNKNKEDEAQASNNAVTDVYRVDVHINTSTYDLGLLHRVFVSLPSTAEVHLFFAGTCNLYDASGLRVAIQGLGCHTVSHISTIYSPTMLLAALCADEVMAGPLSEVALMHSDNYSAGQGTHSEFKNMIEHKDKLQQQCTQLLVDRGMITEEERTVFLNGGIVCFFGEDLQQRLKGVAMPIGRTITV